MRPDSSNQLPDRVIGRGRDPGLLKDLATHVGISNTQQELLLLGALSRRQARRQEVLERGRDLILSNGHNILKCLLGCLKRIAGRELDHLSEPVQTQNGLLDLGQLSTSFIEFLLLEQAVPGGAFVQDEEL